MESVNAVRIRLRYPSLDVFVERFASNVTRGGVFLASRNMQPVGSVIGFEILLVDGQVALAGRGRVTWVKEFNAAEPTRPYGMGVQFVSIDAASKPTLARILRVKELSGPTGRRATGPQAPLGTNPGATAAGVGAGADAGAGSHAGAAVGNGKAAAVHIDTTVDLAAEYGLDEAAVRRVIDRNRRSGPRIEDDLSDLMKPDPIATASLSQALAELPRLLDPQNSRRRATGGFRPVEGIGGGTGSGPIGARPSGAVSPGTGGVSGGVAMSAAPSDPNDATGGGQTASGPIDSNVGPDVGAEAAVQSEASNGDGSAGHGLDGRRGRKRHR